MLTTHPIRSTAAIALALSAISAPAASAMVPRADPPQGTQTDVTPVVHGIAANGGFDWGDAGIGAAGGFALSMVGLGGVLVVSQRQERRPQG
jgi:hypothetical protein